MQLLLFIYSLLTILQKESPKPILEILAMFLQKWNLGHIFSLLVIKLLFCSHYFMIGRQLLGYYS